MDKKRTKKKAAKKKDTRSRSERQIAACQERIK